MTDREKRLVLRGMSLARGVLKNTACEHHDIVCDYQDLIAEGWALDTNSEMADAEQADFMALVAEINDAIAKKHPEWTNQRGQTWQKH